MPSITQANSGLVLALVALGVVLWVVWPFIRWR